MRKLLRNITIIDSRSTFHEQTVDVYIKDGRYADIGKNLPIEADDIIEGDNLHLSPGWLDIGAVVGEPGYEHREDLNSLRSAAEIGGFTAVAILPNTAPVIDHKSGVSYVLNSNATAKVQLYPIGAITKGAEGSELAELMDLNAAGAVAFSDGLHPLQHSGIMLRALQYVNSFDGLVMNRSEDGGLAKGGQLHEGVVSTQLGMRGIPALAEQLSIQRDLGLLDYAGSRLHIGPISTAASVDLIRQAKARGLAVTCSVAVHNLAMTEEACLDFDTNVKLAPPLRSERDRMALLEGLVDGTIDCIVSNHTPWEEEQKKLEFPYAAFGATSLASCFSLARKATASVLKLGGLVEKMAYHSREILKLPTYPITKGGAVDATVFDPDVASLHQVAANGSKSINDPLVGHELRGRVLGILRAV